MTHRTTDELEAGLDHIRDAPADDGELRLIVARPTEDARDVLEEGELDLEVGLVGDDWLARGNPQTETGAAHPLAQLTIMNSRVLDVLAGPIENWPPAGDQLYVDFDIGAENAPAGTRLAIGSAVVEVTDKPHTGCAKFTKRYGHDARRWVNSPIGSELKLRGINARVIEPGPIRTGDRVKKV